MRIPINENEPDWYGVDKRLGVRENPRQAGAFPKGIL